MEELASAVVEVSQPLSAIVDNVAACRRLLASVPNVPAEARACLTDILQDAARASAIIAHVRSLTSQAKEHNPTSRENSDELHARYALLTTREREVLRGVVAGHLNKQIAAHIGISEKTVKFHRAHIMQKMRANSLANLVRMADRVQAP